MHTSEIRNSVRKLLRESVLADFDQQRETEIIEHVDNCLFEFGKELKNLALKNDHPYIKFYLESALHSLKTDIINGSRTLSGIDEMMLNPKMKA